MQFQNVYNAEYNNCRGIWDCVPLKALCHLHIYCSHSYLVRANTLWGSTNTAFRDNTWLPCFLFISGSKNGLWHCCVGGKGQPEWGNRRDIHCGFWRPAGRTCRWAVIVRTVVGRYFAYKFKTLKINVWQVKILNWYNFIQNDDNHSFDIILFY